MGTSITVECPVRYWARHDPDRPALIFGRRYWSYRELEPEVQKWAGILSGLGVDANGRVALASYNRPELAAIHHAAARLGAAVVPLNPRLTELELASAEKIFQPHAVIAEDALSDRLPAAFSLERLATQSSRDSAACRAATLRTDATRAILLTSGTTGRPKAVELTVDNFLANAQASGENLGSNPDQRWLACLPLFHIGGLAMLVRCATYGASLVLHARFDPVEANRALDQDPVTHLSLVETMLSDLLEAKGAREFPTRLKAALVGGGSVAPELMDRARRQGLPVLLTYGLTEATSQVATERVGRADGRTAGEPLPGVEVRTVLDNGTLAEPGEVGEIEVHGPTVMRGYLNDTAATSEAIVDGWLRTGDFGSLDVQGRLTLHSRRGDLIIRGGENIYPAEVEAVLMTHPSVAEAVVVPEWDSRWGQVPVAIIVAGEGGPNSKELDDWCRPRLARFKVPARFIAVPRLPRNAVGKIDRLAAQSLLGSESCPGSVEGR